MIYIAIDLAMKQVGLCAYSDVSHTYQTKTIKQLLDHPYILLDKDSLLDAVERLIDAISEMINDKEQITYLVEGSNIRTNIRFMLFGTSFISCLYGMHYKDNIDVKQIQAEKWMKLADKTFVIHRDKFADGRTGNKQGIKAVVKHLNPPINFNSQDEYDAYLMLETYLLNKKRF